MEIPPNPEGLKLARDRIFKQWQKERQRADDLRKRNDKLLEANERLKRQLRFLEERYIL